jgi:hypothetical protein
MHIIMVQRLVSLPILYNSFEQLDLKGEPGKHERCWKKPLFKKWDHHDKIYITCANREKHPSP